MPLEFEAERDRKVEQAARKAMGTGGADAARYVTSLYQRGSAEDIAAYSIEDILAFGMASWETFQTRAPSEHNLVVTNHDLQGGDGEVTRPVTVIEIQNDNMPFILDSVMGELSESDVEIRLVLHPIVALERDKEGKLTHFHGLHSTGQVTLESIVHIHIDRVEEDDLRADLEARLNATLSDVRKVVVDWRPMLALMKDTIDGYKTNPPPVSVDELAEAIQFLEWLADRNFVLLGMREYAFTGGAGEGELERTEAPGLGLLSDPNMRVLRRGGELVTMTPEVREFLLKPEPLIITKANIRSRVHRRVHLDYVGIKTYTAEGELKGELRLIGLFTSTAYTRAAARIPILRRKVGHVLATAGFDPEGHSGKALTNVLEHYPRDELFQLDEESLLRNAMTVLQLDERPRVRVLTRRDKFDRFVSLIIFAPRDRYSTDVRLRLGEQFADLFDGVVSSWSVSYPEGTLARLHLIIGRKTGPTPDIAQDQLEEVVTHTIRTWNDALNEALANSQSPHRARQIRERYAQAFTAAYREAFDATSALQDIQIVDRLINTDQTIIAFDRREEQDGFRCQLRLYQAAHPIPLSDRVPILENMGFRVVNERTYRITPQASTDEGPGDSSVYLHDMTIDHAGGAEIDLEAGRDRLEAAFMAVWRDKAENDGFNRLTLVAGLAWRDVALLRALARYLRQVRVPYSQDYLWDTAHRHHDLAKLLVELFHARFNPDADDPGRTVKTGAIESKLLAELDAVSSLDDDRIIRSFLEVIKATVRTNFYQIAEDGGTRPTMAFKLMPREISFLPEPRPYREIFVYSPAVEGVHLRFGAVARGGLRWSDRPQDFRTEVLGLVKAQQVKNAVIVPVGAKGGFFPKRLPVGGSRSAFFTAGTEAYKTFIGSLLDVTDNLVDDETIPPRRVVRHDGDDPYLVVAADKGTATFSDTANGISDSRGFWLSDAFASGGSAGYDHKKMGITARGAWEAVKRHFREMNHDIQTQPFTVVGVGDMSGDVFGNGMLLSRATKLVAAFDHRDIFIDPDPDPETSHAERQRVFELGRSSWKDYNKDLISEGGGVFSRSTKSLKLSAQARKAIGFDKASGTPIEVMRAILKSDVDLLWFGGIGTYVRATIESDADVGDRTNDPLRITAPEISARVIGEGANLGLTQRARIEFSAHGGRCNSDAVDNSAGVNSSDVEVNIKIALGAAVRTSKLTLEKRNTLLAKMTDEVADLVLRNNYLQTLSISLSERKGMEAFGFQRRLMQVLEQRGLLDREVEELPDDLELAEREADGRPLTRPEIGVLLAYAKITLFDDLLETGAPDDPFLIRELTGYFPQAMSSTYADEITTHRLRREIISTVLANAIINDGGATFIVRIADRTGASISEIATAYAIAREVFNLADLGQAIDALDTRVPGDVQLQLYAAVQDLLEDCVVWFLRNADLAAGIEHQVARFKKGLGSLTSDTNEVLSSWTGGRAQQDADAWIQSGVPVELANKVALLPGLSTVPDIVLVSETTGRSIGDVETTFRAVGAHFRIARIRATALSLSVSDYYDGLALDRGIHTLAGAHRRISTAILTDPECETAGEEAFENWRAKNAFTVDRTLSTVETITDGEHFTVSKLAVAAGLLADLSGGT